MLVLRTGMFVSFGLMALGIVMYLAYEGQVGIVLMPWEAVRSALMGEAQGFLSLGVLCLIVTPLTGVVAALLVFMRAREWEFAGVALAVMGVVGLAILVKLLA